MNLEAITSMEDFARKVLSLSPESRDAYWAELKENALLTAEDIEILQKCVAFYRLHTDNRFRRAVRESVQAMYTAEMNA